MRRIGIGIDFGTSNCSVAVYDGHRLRLLRLEPGTETPDVQPTALYLDRSHRALIGRRAIDTYLRDNAGRVVQLEPEELGELEYFVADTEDSPGAKGTDLLTDVWKIHALVDRGQPGRLFRGLKRWLGYSSLDRVRVFDRRYRIVALITPILANLAERIRGEVGAGPAAVHVGRPVRFEGAGAATETALERLAESCGYAQLGRVTFYPEPVAAARSYLRRGDAPGDRDLVLAFDFGGGTLDLTLVRAGGGDFEVLATHGIGVGGDEIDRRVYREKVFPELGEGCRIPNALATGTERFPFRDLAPRLLNWPLAYELNRADVREVIRSGMKGAPETAEKLARLYALVTRNQSYRVFRAVEHAKRALSTGRDARIEVEELGLSVALSRAELEAVIAELLGRVERCVRETLELAGIGPEEVRVVVRTGGTSQIPAVQGVLERIFPGRVVAHDLFTSIAAGLALASYRGAPSPLDVAAPPP